MKLPVAVTVAILATLLVVLLVLLDGRGRSGEGGGEPDAPNAETNGAPDPATGLLDVERRAADPGTSADEDPEATEPVDEPLEDVGALPPGLLRFQVAEAASGTLLNGVTVSLESTQRFARFEANSADAVVDVPLSPGAYRIVLTCEGFDPHEADGAVIVSAERTDLGTLYLERGRAELAGKIAAPVAPGSELRVELFGAGRNPCPQCVQEDPHCARCGYGEAFSLQTVDAGQRFDFGALAAGEYQLWVRDAALRTVAMRRLELEAGERRWLELEVNTVDLLVLTQTVSGEPMEGEWLEDGELWAAAIRYAFMQEQLCLASAELQPPGERPGAEPEEVMVDEGEGEEIAAPTEAQRRAELHPGETQPDADSRIDVARRPYISIWPRIVPTGPTTAPLSAKRLGLGLALIRSVPVDATALIVTCGPSFSIPQPLDLANWDGEPIVVVLMDRCGMDSETMQQMELKTCNACHALPASTLR